MVDAGDFKHELLNQLRSTVAVNVLTADPDDTDSMIFFTAENEDIQPSYEEVTHVI